MTTGLRSNESLGCSTRGVRRRRRRPARSRSSDRGTCARVAQGDLRPAGRRRRRPDGQQQRRTSRRSRARSRQPGRRRAVHGDHPVHRREGSSDDGHRSDGAKLRRGTAGGTADVETRSPNPGFIAFAELHLGRPAHRRQRLKPDITAPGVSIFSTGVGTGNGAAIEVRYVDGIAARRGRGGTDAPGSPDVDGRGHQGGDRQHRRSFAGRSATASAAAAPASSSRRSRPQTQVVANGERR